MRDSLGMNIVEPQKKIEPANLSTSPGRLSGKDAMEKLGEGIRSKLHIIHTVLSS